MKIYGVDISVFQRGIDMESLKDEDVEFAIIRAGYTGSTNKSFAKDTEFENHYKKAKESGLDVGAYWFSRATSYEEGKSEALYLYNNCLIGKLFEYPIYMDVEDSVYQQKAGKYNVTQAIIGFCEALEELGYYVGVYCNLNWAKNYINYNELKDKYDFWLAFWSKNEPNRSNYRYGMWQFGGETNLIRSNRLSGMVCDQNYAFKNYPEIMKNRGFNGYKIEEPIIENPEPIEEPIIENPEPIDEPIGIPELEPIDIPVKVDKNTGKNNLLNKIVYIVVDFIINLFKKKK